LKLRPVRNWPEVQTKVKAMPVKKGTVRTMESYMIKNGKPGDQFYSNKKDKDLTAIATQHKRKITTNRLIVVDGTSQYHPTVKGITKITLL